MVRVGGMSYACAPAEKMGRRIDDMRLAGNMRLAGKPIEADRTYKVAGWAPVAEGARGAGRRMIWDVVEEWLKAHPKVAARKLETLRLVGMEGNPGLA
jgi:sulfur-oxidizing protein SoxB